MNARTRIFILACICFSLSIRVSAQQALSLSVNVHESEGTKTACEEVRVTSVSRSTLLPLLPYIFFERESAELPRRYAQYGMSEAQDFIRAAHEVVVGDRDRSVISTYYNLLNVIGRRLVLNPLAQITLQGGSVSDEDEGLSRRRAVKVKEYLETHYPQVRGRVLLASKILRRAKEDDVRLTDESRCVVISGDWEVLKPVVVRDSGIVVTPTAVELSVSGLRGTPQEYQVTASRCNAVDPLLSYDDIEVPAHPIVWKLNQNSLGLSSPNVSSADALCIRARVAYEDSPLIDTVLVQLPIMWSRSHEPSSRNVLVRREYVYNLILFNRDASDLRSDHIRVIDSLIADDRCISAMSTIRVIGYADSTGSLSRNQELSQDRADQVAQRIRKRYGPVIASDGIAEVRGVGTYDVLNLLDGQATPESRFYSRTVTVKVEESP